MLKRQIERKFFKSKNFQNFDLLGAWRSGGMNDMIFFTEKGTLLRAWIYVWAIFHEIRLGSSL